jgi:hypothetical protein
VNLSEVHRFLDRFLDILEDVACRTIALRARSICSKVEISINMKKQGSRFASVERYGDLRFRLKISEISIYHLETIADAWLRLARRSATAVATADAWTYERWWGRAVATPGTSSSGQRRSRYGPTSRQH